VRRKSPFEQIAYEDVFTGFKFPKALGSFQFQNRIQYAHVDLGYGVNYADRTGATATIVVFDLNLRGIANGTEDSRVLEELAKMDEAIASVARQGGYRSFNRVESPRLSKAWLQVSHELVRPDGRKAYAHSFIRGQSGRFVKVRVTTPSEGTFARLPIFLLGVSRAVGMLNNAE
jgi:hypothetical protein